MCGSIDFIWHSIKLAIRAAYLIILVGFRGVGGWWVWKIKAAKHQTVIITNQITPPCLPAKDTGVSDTIKLNDEYGLPSVLFCLCSHSSPCVSLSLTPHKQIHRNYPCCGCWCVARASYIFYHWRPIQIENRNRTVRYCRYCLSGGCLGLS